MPLETTDVRVYMHNKVMVGTINLLAPEIRLIEVLGGLTSYKPENQDGFLELTDVTILRENCAIKMIPIHHIRRSSMQIVATLAADSGRGLGAKTGPKSYPFIDKSPFLVELETSDYEISGTIYLTTVLQSWQALDNDPPFLPVTNAEIYSLVDRTFWKVPFAAVNKTHIVSIVYKSTAVSKLTSKIRA
jgi:hypothetical protein